MAAGTQACPRPPLRQAMSSLVKGIEVGVVGGAGLFYFALIPLLLECSWGSGIQLALGKIEDLMEESNYDIEPKAAATASLLQTFPNVERDEQSCSPPFLSFLNVIYRQT